MDADLSTFHTPERLPRLWTKIVGEYVSAASRQAHGNSSNGRYCRESGRSHIGAVMERLRLARSGRSPKTDVPEQFRISA
jgi:hypothetical protein